MGACCQKPRSRSTEQNGHGDISPIKSGRPDITNVSNLTFPRYPVLPPIVQKDGEGAALGDYNMSHDAGVLSMYNRYKDANSSMITSQGIQQLCDDLQLNPEDFRVLLLAYSLGAEIMCQFTEKEFVQGCSKLHIHDIQSMKESIPLTLKQIEGSAFGTFYRWAYKFSLDHESGQRTLSTEMAVLLWRLIFTNNKPAILDRWLAYVESCANVKGISKDTWDMFLVFVDQIGDDLQAYDDTEAWPSLLDDFVEHELEKAAEEQASVRL